LAYNKQTHAKAPKDTIYSKPNRIKKNVIYKANNTISKSQY